VGIVGITVGDARSRLLLVVALTLAFTVLSLESVPPHDNPTEMWAPHAAAFLWTGLVWDGRSRPGSELSGHLLSQLLVFLGVALVLGWGPLDAAWMGLTNIAGGALMVWLWARVGRGPTPAPETALANLLLLATATVVATLIALAGGFHNLDVGELDRLTLWWVIRGTVYAYVAGVTFLLVFHGSRDVLAPAPRWALAALVPLGAACVWVTYLDPALPLTWFLLLPALVGGSILSPRGAATYALFIAVLGALATLFPINQFGYEGFLPGSVILDLLITASTFITIHLANLRLARATTTAELERQRRTAEDQAALLGTVFETMTDGLVVVDADNRVLLHNDAARHLVGRQIPVRQQVDWVDYLGLHRVDGEPLSPSDLPRGRGERQRQVVVRNEGADRVLEIGAWPLAGTGQMVVLFSDVTAQRERLTELTSFAGVVAHDLRAPLSSLHGWLEMAEDALRREGHSRAAGFVARAQLSSVRMRSVIEDWLAYTVQRDGLLTRAEVPLAEVVEEIVASYGVADAGAVPDFVVSAPHVVEADRVLVTQLLANLIGNAVKYCPEGERPRVEIRSFLDAEQGFVRVEVSDRGIGLPPGEEEKVFEEFHRAAAHRGSFSGTGLGLSLCRRIVNRHGGSIFARNNPDRGATFSFTLPAA
jgi:signal transduction histidine kinase